MTFWEDCIILWLLGGFDLKSRKCEQFRVTEHLDMFEGGWSGENMKMVFDVCSLAALVIQFRKIWGSILDLCPRTSYLPVLWWAMKRIVRSHGKIFHIQIISIFILAGRKSNLKCHYLIIGDPSATGEGRTWGPSGERFTLIWFCTVRHRLVGQVMWLN